MTKLKLTEVPKDMHEVINKEASFMDNLISFIESLVHSTDASDSVDNEKQDPHEEDEWTEETQKLISLYK